MILLTLIGILFFPSQLLNQQSHKDSVILIKGNCYDINTRVSLNTKIVVMYEKSKATFVTDKISGNFSFITADSAKFLIFESEGYNTAKLPVNVIGNLEGKANFEISVPMIEKKWQQFTLQEQRLNEQKTQTGSSEGSIKVAFEIFDAINSSPLTANICLTNMITGKRECFVTNTMNPTWFTSLELKNTTNFEISVKGYHTYSGKLGTIESNNNEFRYQVQLLRPVNFVSVYFYPSDTLYSNGVLYGKFHKTTGPNLPLSKKMDDIIPGSYEVLLQEDIKKIKRKITIAPGLNFMSVPMKAEIASSPNNSKTHTVSQPKELSLEKQETKNSNLENRKPPVKYFENATLYFEKSRYTLTNEAKATLDSVSLFLTDQRDMVAYITGFTDNVGKRENNMTLSEYRARTTVKYLIEIGVENNQLSFDWKGPDSPVVPNGTKEINTKNQRVEIRFKSKYKNYNINKN